VKRRRGSRRTPASSGSAEPQVAARVEEFFARLDRLATNSLGQTLLPAADPERRIDVRTTAIAAAIAAGRRQTLAEVRRVAREAALARFGSRAFRPTWAGLNWGQSLGTVEDRVNLARILDDAALAAVAGDLVDTDSAADLWSGLEALEAFADRGPAEQSFELAARRRPTFSRLYIAFILFGWTGAAFAAVGQLGPPGLLGLTAIAVVLVVVAIRRLAPTESSIELEADREG
jgi:hypothetical protein